MNNYPNLPKTSQSEATSLATPRTSVPSSDILQLQANVNLSAAQTNESQQRQLATQQEISQWLHQNLESRFAELQHLESIRQRAESELKEAHAQKEAALADRQKADETRKEASDNLASARAESEKAAADKKDAEAANEEATNKLAQLDASFSWPSSLQGKAWEDWRNTLRVRIASEWQAALVLSRLQVLASLLRSPDPSKTVLHALNDLGQATCQFDSQKAAELASALTQGAQGDFEITMPKINDVVDRIWMRPAPNATKVTRILGWCVKDKQGTVQFQALVE